MESFDTFIQVTTFILIIPSPPELYINYSWVQYNDEWGLSISGNAIGGGRIAINLKLQQEGSVWHMRNYKHWIKQT